MRKFFAGRPFARFKKFLAERPVVRFALLSFSLPIITLILLVVLAQIPKDIQEQISRDTLSLSTSRELCPKTYDDSQFTLFFLTAPLVALQFHGTAGLIFYSVIVNNKALRQVGIKNVALLVIGSVLTTLAFFFVNELICSPSHDWIRFAIVVIFQLSSTSILIAVRYTLWKISMKKFFAERPLLRFALLSFSLPIVTLILLVVLAQIPPRILCPLSNGDSYSKENISFSLIFLPLVLQFFGIIGLIFYGGIVNNKALTQVGIRNVTLLVIGSVLTTLLFFFVCLQSYLPLIALLFGAAILQLISTSILIAIRHALWKAWSRTAKG